MTRSRFSELLWPLALTAALVGGVACACTNVYCWDSATVTVRRADGSPLALAVTVDLDGDKIDCAAPEPYAPGRSGPPCHPRVDVTRRGDREQVIDIRESAPKRITVTLRDGSRVVAEKTFAPDYESYRPNGFACEPTCRQWSDTWIVP